MYTEPLFDDVVIYKIRSLTKEERIKIVDQIYYIQEHLNEEPNLGVVKAYSPEMLHELSDDTLLTIINYQQMLFAFNFFRKNGKRPNIFTKL